MFFLHIHNDYYHIKHIIIYCNISIILNVIKVHLAYKFLISFIRIKALLSNSPSLNSPTNVYINTFP